MSERRGHLLPVYVLADESASMGDCIGELDAGLNSLREALRAEPVTASKVRVSVLGFSDDVVIHVHLADLRRVAELPRLAARASTNYGAAFAALQRLIPQDVWGLKASRYGVHRPVVFFLSDGQPSDEGWQVYHRRLTDRHSLREAPNIIACGIGDAEPETIIQVATAPAFAYVAITGTDVGSAIATFSAALTRSVVASGRSVASGQPELVFDKPEGFRMAIDVI